MTKRRCVRVLLYIHMQKKRSKEGKGYRRKRRKREKEVSCVLPSSWSIDI